MRKQFLVIGAFVLAVLAVDFGAPIAEACPMCRAANETESALPKAYMYSILFMLTVPATVLTAFGIGFFRLSNQPPIAVDDVDFLESSAADGPQTHRGPHSSN